VHPASVNMISLIPLILLQRNNLINSNVTLAGWWKGWSIIGDGKQSWWHRNQHYFIQESVRQGQCWSGTKKLVCWGQPQSRLLDSWLWSKFWWWCHFYLCKPQQGVDMHDQLFSMVFWDVKSVIHLGPMCDGGKKWLTPIAGSSCCNTGFIISWH